MSKSAYSLFRKRKLLHDKSSTPDKLIGAGEAFLEAGRYYDAVDFFEKADARDRLAEMVEAAITEGDTALLLRVKKLLGEEPEPEELRRAALKATESGRSTMALVAYKRLGDRESARAIAAELGLTPQKALPESPKQDSE